MDSRGRLGLRGGLSFWYCGTVSMLLRTGHISLDIVCWRWFGAEVGCAFEVGETSTYGFCPAMLLNDDGLVESAHSHYGMSCNFVGGNT